MTQPKPSEPVVEPPPVAAPIRHARRSDTVEYCIEEAGKVATLPAIVLEVHPIIAGEPQAIDLHVCGRERHGGFFERVYVEKGEPGDVGRWSWPAP